MSDVTDLLARSGAGDATATEQLLPLIYDELRRLAAAQLARERPGQTWQATALVHEAWLRLVKDAERRGWDSRGHFFAAAAESMRRLLIQAARRKQTLKRGGNLQRHELGDWAQSPAQDTLDLLALDEALSELEAVDRLAAELVKLRLFAGFSVDEAGQALGLPHTSAYRQWTYAQAWLKARLAG